LRMAEVKTQPSGLGKQFRPPRGAGSRPAGVCRICIHRVAPARRRPRRSPTG